MASWLENLKAFFSDEGPQPEQQKLVEQTKKETPRKKEKRQQQKRKIYTFDDLKFDYDNYSVQAGRGVSITAGLKFANGYHMYVSIVNFTDGYLDSKAKFLKHDYLSAYKITIDDANNRRNNTCLNKDGESIIAYSKKDVTNIMKQIQQLDKNGRLPTVKTNTKVEARKNHIKKVRDLRKKLEERNKENSVSGVIIADKIADKIISGEEKRQITPDVVAEYKKNTLLNK